MNEKEATSAPLALDAMDIKFSEFIWSVIPEPIAIIDANLTFRAVNPAYAKLLVQTPEQMVGRSVREYMDGREWVDFIHAVLQRGFRGERVQWEGWRTYQQTGRAYVSALIQPIIAQDGTVPFVIAFVGNRTEYMIRCEEAQAALLLAEDTESSATQAERRLDDAIRCLPHGFRLTDPAGRLIKWNLNFEEMFSRKAGIVLFQGMPLLDFMLSYSQYNPTEEIEIDGVTIPGNLENRLRIQQRHSASFVSRDSQGRYIWTEERRTMDGGSVAVHTDITSLRRALAGAHHALGTKDALFDAIGAPVFVRNPEGVYVDCNAAFAEFLGVPRQEIIGKPVTALAPPDLAAAYLAHDQEVLAGRREATRETVNDIPRLGRRKILMSKRVYHRTDAAPAGIVGVMMDVTELDQALKDAEAARHEAQATLAALRERETALETALASSVEALRTKATLLSIVSHELRTPLNAIMGFADVMLMEEPHEASRAMLVEIGNSARRLSDTVDAMIELAGTDVGEAATAGEDFEPWRLVDRILCLLAPRAMGKGLRLTGTYPEQGKVIGDPQRIRSVIVKLVDNAIKFTEQGSVAVAVRVEAQEDGACQLRVSVADTGVGIGPEDVQHLFKEFRQLDMTATRRTEGMGLGLAVCRKYVEAMGGTIAVTSEPGRGSVFSFTIPVGISGVCADAEATAGETHKVYAQTSAPPGPSSPRAGA